MVTKSNYPERGSRTLKIAFQIHHPHDHYYILKIVPNMDSEVLITSRILGYVNHNSYTKMFH